MATITAESIVNKVAVLIQDTTNIRWPKSDLYDYLNAGQREIVLLKPNAYVKNTSFTLAAGSKQTIPADGVDLIDVPRNTSGQAITLVARAILDAQVPNWHLATGTRVQHYCFSERDPKTFYVYPSSAGSVEIIYSASPPNVNPGGVISLDDIYESALIDYICYRAYLKDTEYAENMDNANRYYTAFRTALTGKQQSESVTDPNTRKFGNPNV